MLVQARKWFLYGDIQIMFGIMISGILLLGMGSCVLLKVTVKMHEINQPNQTPAVKTIPWETLAQTYGLPIHTRGQQTYLAGNTQHLIALLIEALRFSQQPFPFHLEKSQYHTLLVIYP